MDKKPTKFDLLITIPYSINSYTTINKPLTGQPS